MKRTKRIVTGIAFTAMLALSLIAGGGDADAKTRGRADFPPPPTSTSGPSLDGLFQALGVTWE